ncbi:1102_t:CDS:1, partial [Diversispora eburnea]
IQSFFEKLTNIEKLDDNEISNKGNKGDKDNEDEGEGEISDNNILSNSSRLQN